jgi:dihydrofolate reductase
MNIQTHPLTLIASMGTSGQIGLNGLIPWAVCPELEEQNSHAQAEFERATQGGILIMGVNTYDNLPDTGWLEENIVEVWRRERYSDTPLVMISDLMNKYPGKPIFVVGGKTVFSRFMPLIDRFVLFRHNYDGEADCFMPPILPCWEPVIERQDIASQFVANDAIPRNYVLLQREKVPVWFGARTEIPPKEFNTVGTTSYVHSATLEWIMARLHKLDGKPN